MPPILRSERCHSEHCHSCRRPSHRHGHRRRRLAPFRERGCEEGEAVPLQSLASDVLLHDAHNGFCDSARESSSRDKRQHNGQCLQGRRADIDVVAVPGQNNKRQLWHFSKHGGVWSGRSSSSKFTGQDPQRLRNDVLADADARPEREQRFADGERIALQGGDEALHGRRDVPCGHLELLVLALPRRQSKRHPRVPLLQRSTLG
mmetsp:Transcript_70634/g.202395  ORF Transcript_70634/g.202395 Transcript_70634/m.202395 type:complete len:204 (-) Transcript_70634:137-748(-)